MRRQSWRYWVKKQLLFPLVGKALSAPVVAGQTMDSGLDQDESVLGILVLSALLQVPSDVHCLLDQAVDILRNLRGAT